MTISCEGVMVVGEPCRHAGRSHHKLVRLTLSIRRCNLTWVSGRIQEPFRSMACPESPEQEDAPSAEPGGGENAVRPAFPRLFCWIRRCWPKPNQSRKGTLVNGINMRAEVTLYISLFLKATYDE